MTAIQPKRPISNAVSESASAFTARPSTWRAPSCGRIGRIEKNWKAMPSAKAKVKSKRYSQGSARPATVNPVANTIQVAMMSPSVHPAPQ